MHGRGELNLDLPCVQAYVSQKMPQKCMWCWHVLSLSLLRVTNGSDPGWGWKEKGNICCLGLSIYEESDGIAFSCTWKDNQSQNLSAWSWKWGKKQLQILKVKASPLTTPISNSKRKTGGDIQILPGVWGGTPSKRAVQEPHQCWYGNGSSHWWLQANLLLYICYFTFIIKLCLRKTHKQHKCPSMPGWCS